MWSIWWSICGLHLRLLCGLALFDDDLGKVLIVLVVEVDDLHADSDDLFEHVVETDCFVGLILGNVEHLEGLELFVFPLQRDHNLVGRKAVVQKLQDIGIVLQRLFVYVVRYSQ